MMKKDAIASFIEEWHGIVPADPIAFEFAEDIARVIAAFDALDPAPFEGEPADFIAVLETFREIPFAQK